ncbi:hypothetical protein ACFW0H_14975 [Pseudomonas sp. CR3202]|uniref:hypothetical protein n=1 Tax=Pseudomonas sp. CR3202 TaxID=3351532 RepID=UPI003BEFFC00
MAKTGIICVFITGVFFGLAGAFSIHPGKAASSDNPAAINTRDGIIRFMIDGEEQARIDAGGFHVKGDINYSGTITDSVTFAPYVHPDHKASQGTGP